MREGNAERGFTLIELMAVVAIVAILAAVVVPTWMRETTKSKRKAEVAAMFAEIGVKQEQFKTENGKYMGDRTDSDYEGTTTCPASVPSTDYNFASSCSVSNSAWQDMRVQETSASLRCQYSITAGISGTTLTPPTGFENSKKQKNTAEPTLASGWYYIHATCDENGKGGTNAQYYQSSVDHRIQAINEGS